MSRPRFPKTFWAANSLELFERWAYYGVFNLLALYLTGSADTGALGFSQVEKGLIMGIVNAILYFLPVITGSIADRYGYKNMFLASAVVMAPAYILLIAPRTFWGFLGVYFLVAVGHGMFKPVVISTVAKTTDEKTGSMGFGIFYMMVNIGGFLGPIVAGVVRGWDWKYVFWASAGWIVIMGVTAAGVVPHYKTTLHSEISAIEITTHAIENMINQKYISRPGWAVALEVMALLYFMFLVLYLKDTGILKRIREVLLP